MHRTLLIYLQCLISILPILPAQGVILLPSEIEGPSMPAPKMASITESDKFPLIAIFQLNPARIDRIIRDIPPDQLLHFDRQRGYILQIVENQAALEALLTLPEVECLQLRAERPREELITAALDLRPNRIHSVHHEYPMIAGKDSRIIVTEQKFNFDDIDFKDRILRNNYEADGGTTHASVMATLIAGGGNSSPNSKGVAWMSELLSVDFGLLMPLPDDFYLDYNTSIQNHSYGVEIENFYGIDAAAYDQSAIDHPVLLHVFSAGNMGSKTSPAGHYADAHGYANLTGSFKQCKNCLVVGVTDTRGQPASESSKGPAYDGRIKPELVAFGSDGTSGGAALVSGAVALLHQYHRILYGFLPSSAVTKCLLINAAKDLGSEGPDYATGFGSLDMLRSIRLLEEESFLSDTILSSSGHTYAVEVPPASLLKVTLVWTDLPAPAGSEKALQNDLDVLLVSPVGDTIKPWVLSSRPMPDSLALPATRGIDRLNNVEQVSLQYPIPGTYMIEIKAHHLITGRQEFAIAYDIVASEIMWNYPLKDDHLVSANEVLLQWSSTELTEQPPFIEFSTDAVIWTQIKALETDGEFALWHVPDTITLGYLRLTLADQQVMTGPFQIAPRPELHVELYCPDSVLLTWEEVPQVKSYVLSNLGDQYLELQALTNRSAFNFSPLEIPAVHWALGARFPNFSGEVRSLTINYTIQGSDCYINNFSAALEGDQGVLHLELTSERNVQEIRFEKLETDDYLLLKKFAVNGLLQYRHKTNNLQQGRNNFRASVVLRDGQIIYSDSSTVFYPGTDDFFVFPNPLPRSQFLTIVAKDHVKGDITVIDLSGKVVWSAPLFHNYLEIDLAMLIPGIYFYQITGANENSWGKLFVQ